MALASVYPDFYWDSIQIQFSMASPPTKFRKLLRVTQACGTHNRVEVMHGYIPATGSAKKVTGNLF